MPNDADKIVLLGMGGFREPSEGPVDILVCESAREKSVLLATLLQSATAAG
jgi:hypothetical protein